MVIVDMEEIEHDLLVVIMVVVKEGTPSVNYIYGGALEMRSSSSKSLYLGAKILSLILTSFLPPPVPSRDTQRSEREREISFSWTFCFGRCRYYLERKKGKLCNPRLSDTCRLGNLFVFFYVPLALLASVLSLCDLLLVRWMLHFLSLPLGRH